MRYNPDTERGLTLDKIDTSVPDAANLYPQPSEVWDCQNGHWIPNPVLAVEPEPEPSPTDTLVGEVTLQLWGAYYKLQRIAIGAVPPATIASLKQDVQDVARELQRLS